MKSLMEMKGLKQSYLLLGINSLPFPLHTHLELSGGITTLAVPNTPVVKTLRT